MDNIKDKIIQAILDSDRTSANQLIDTYAAEYGYKDAIQKILEPLLVEVGTKWNENISLAHGYIAGKVCEDIMNKAEKSKEFKGFDLSKGKIILGNAEDDYHSLGRKMLVVFLKADGWEVIDLGNDVTAEEFVDSAIEHKSKIIAVSAMMYTTAINIKKIREEIDKRDLKNKIMLAVGGAIFNLDPSLIEKLGGDGSAKNALQVSSLLEELLKNIEED